MLCTWTTPLRRFNIEHTHGTLRCFDVCQRSLSFGQDAKIHCLWQETTRGSVGTVTFFISAHAKYLAAVDPQLMMDMLVHHFSVIAHRLDRFHLLRRPGTWVSPCVSYPQLPETRTEGTLRWVRGGAGGQQPLLWAHGRPMGSQDAVGGNSAQRRVVTCWGLAGGAGWFHGGFHGGFHGWFHVNKPFLLVIQ